MGPPLIKIIFFLAVNIVPSEQATFRITLPKDEVITFTKQEHGGWKPSPAPKHVTEGVWSLDGDILKIMRTDGGSGLRMSQFFLDLDTIDWKAVTKLTEGKIPVKLVREKSQVTVVRGYVGQEQKFTIAWTPYGEDRFQQLPAGDDLKATPDVTATKGAHAFMRQVVQSLLDDGNKITFEVVDRLFAMDNGETLSREDLQKAWPEFAEEAFKKKVSVDQFFRDVGVRVTSPLDNKRLMSNKRVLNVYKYQKGDLYCDASHVKEGVENFIAYDKAFIFIIRKVEGKWALVGIGG